MTPTERDALINRQHRVLNIICAALAASLALYGAIGWFWVGSPFYQAPVDNIPDPLLWGLVVVALTMLGVASLMGSRLEAAKSAQGNEPENRVAAYFAAVIITFAIREGAGILGLVMTLLSGQGQWSLLLPAAALVAMALDWPSRRRIEERVSLRPTTAPKR